MKLIGQRNCIAQSFDSEALSNKRIDFHRLSIVSGGREINEGETVIVGNSLGKGNQSGKKSSTD